MPPSPTPRPLGKCHHYQKLEQWRKPAHAQASVHSGVLQNGNRIWTGLNHSGLRGTVCMLVPLPQPGRGGKLSFPGPCVLLLS